MLYNFKMQLHPCCGKTKFGTRCIALADLVFGLIGIFWFVYMLERYGLLLRDSSYIIVNPSFNFTPMYEDQALLEDNSTQSVKIVSFISIAALNQSNQLFTITPDGIELNGKSANILLSAFYTVINLAVFVLLLSATHNIRNKFKKNIIKLEIWFYIRLSIFVFKIVLYTAYIVLGIHMFPQLPHVIFMAVHGYGLWVVMVFIQEVRFEERIKKAKQRSLGFITVFDPMPIVHMQNKPID